MIAKNAVFAAHFSVQLASIHGDLIMKVALKNAKVMKLLNSMKFIDMSSRILMILFSSATIEVVILLDFM